MRETIDRQPKPPDVTSHLRWPASGCPFREMHHPYREERGQPPARLAPSVHFPSWHLVLPGGQRKRQVRRPGPIPVALAAAGRSAEWRFGTPVLHSSSKQRTDHRERRAGHTTKNPFRAGGAISRIIALMQRSNFTSASVAPRAGVRRCLSNKSSAPASYT